MWNLGVQRLRVWISNYNRTTRFFSSLKCQYYGPQLDSNMIATFLSVHWLVFLIAVTWWWNNNNNNNNNTRLGHAVRYRPSIASLRPGSHLSGTDRAAADSYATFDTATLPWWVQQVAWLRQHCVGTAQVGINYAPDWWITCFDITAAAMQLCFFKPDACFERDI